MTVRDRFGGPLPGVSVQVLDGDGSLLASGLTNREGIARVSTGGQGTRVAVRATLPRFLDAEETNVALRPDCQATVELTMLAGPPDAGS